MSMIKKGVLITNIILMIFLCGCSLSVTENDDAGLELSIEYFGDTADDNDSEKIQESEDNGKESDLQELPAEDEEEPYEGEARAGEADTKSGILSDTSDINLRDTDGNGKNYLFTYDSEDFKAVYTKDNWKIYDSYKINNTEDITIICEALISVHQIHGSDMESYRTADDMTYEWLQHNIAYYFLPEDNSWKVNAKNVDLDPKDQGKSFDEIYEDRTGKKFSFGDFLSKP